MKFALVFFVLLYSCLAFGQVQVKGSLANDISQNEISLEVYLPIGGVFNPFYLNDTKELKIINRKFQFILPVDSGLVVLISPVVSQKIFIYVTYPNTEINLRLIRIGDKIVYNFEGKTGPFLNLMTQVIDYKYIFATEYAEKPLKENKPSIKIVESIQTGVSKWKINVSKMFEKGLITQKEKNLLNREITCDFYSASIDKLSYYLSDKTISNKNTIKESINKLFVIFNPFDTAFKYCFLGNNLTTIARLINNKIIEGDYSKTNSAYWKLYPPNCERLAYLPNKWQEIIAGQYFIIGYVYGFTETSIQAVFPGYKKIFPHSPYISFVEKLMANNKEDTILTPPNADTANLVIFKNHKFDSTAYIDNINTLDDLLIHFKGQYLFIDLWATWCAPCLREMQFASQLHEYLAGKNIIPLFISIDQRNFKNIWYSIIKKYRLEGYHYFSENRQDFVKNITGKIYENNDFTIPRYVLIGKNGKILLNDADRPGSGKKLFKQIEEVMK